MKPIKAPRLVADIVVANTTLRMDYEIWLRVRESVRERLMLTIWGWMEHELRYIPDREIWYDVGEVIDPEGEYGKASQNTRFPLRDGDEYGQRG
jgi:hypothetical protein